MSSTCIGSIPSGPGTLGVYETLRHRRLHLQFPRSVQFRQTADQNWLPTLRRIFLIHLHRMFLGSHEELRKAPAELERL